jgi:signal peptidase II
MRLLPFAIVAVVVFLDQWLKNYSVTNVPIYQYSSQDLYAGTVSAIPGFLSLGLAFNKGAAWSLFYGGVLPLTVLRLVVGAGILWYVFKNHKQLTLLQNVALGLIVGGAFGNGLDGLLRGHVVDMLISHWLTFIYFPIGKSVFPVFNIADMGVVSGTLLLLLSGYLPKPAAQQQP